MLHRPVRLSTLKHNRVRASRAEIARSLEGNWREELLFVLEQSLELYDLYVLKTAVCDQRIEQHLKTMTSKAEPVPTSDPAALPPPKQETRFSLKDHLCRITGVDLTKVWPASADCADHHFGGRRGHEPLGNRKAVCLMAGAVSRQTD